jgi:glycogen debranching enzyme
MTMKQVCSLIRLRPRPEALYTQRGRSVLITGQDGFIGDGLEHGLFVHETRLLSRFRYEIDGEPVQPVALSAIERHTWLGYYLVAAPGADGLADQGSGMMTIASEETLEMRLRRTVGPGMAEEVQITNYSRQEASFELTLEVDADFADVQETTGERQQKGYIEKTWHGDEPVSELRFDYRAENSYRNDGEEAHVTLHRGAILRVEKSDTGVRFADGKLLFRIRLAPHEQWRADLRLVPLIHDQGIDLPEPPDCDTSAADELERRTNLFLDRSAKFESPDSRSLAPVVIATLERAQGDLAAMRLFDRDRGDDAWTMAAGLPIYAAFYGRDTLTTGWQAAMLGPEMMAGSLAEIAHWQGKELNPWRDEEPGRMPHEIHTGPLKVLGHNPNRRNYGTVTTSAFYPVIVSELWHWTGDKERVRPFIEPALKALRWLDEHSDRNGDGFYDYKTMSAQGVKHQAWKDSPGAIVDEHGIEVEPPIATCEEQGFVYLAKLHLSEVLFWLGQHGEARRLFGEARDLKKRFNEAFWMEDLGFYAMALDQEGRHVRSIGSNPGHCLATAIVDTERAERTVERLFQPDMFSGWGIRTLSADHPAYNPYSYHRGSIWPVEHGTFSLAMMRYGKIERMHQLCRGMFEAAAVFQHYCLPEVFSGHVRSAEQPFPAVYPQSNSPQAWSASAVFCMVQSMLGLYPYAPLNMLLIDPHLPEWLPELTVRNLRVGQASTTIRFYRTKSGRTRYKVLEKDGSLHVLRQPSPWSLTAGYAERAKDALVSLLPGK